MPMMKAAPSRDKNISLVKMFVHEERKSAIDRKKSDERSVAHASEEMGPRPLYDMMVIIGKRECKIPEDSAPISPVLCSENFFMFVSISKVPRCFLPVHNSSQT